MAEQLDIGQFYGMFKTMGEQLSGLTTTVGAQGVAKVIKPFDGNSKEFKEWVKSIEKYSMLVGLTQESIKLVAYQSSRGAVSDFMKRFMDANPRHTWRDIKIELQARFAEVIDPQHALLLLRKVRQRSSEPIQVYAERLIALGDDAFEGQGQDVRDRQLIGYFIDGLFEDPMKLKVMRTNPRTLQEAIDTATNEQNLQKRFRLRTGHEYFQNDRSTGVHNSEQPMDVDHWSDNQSSC